MVEVPAVQLSKCLWPVVSDAMLPTCVCMVCAGLKQHNVQLVACGRSHTLVVSGEVIYNFTQGHLFKQNVWKPDGYAAKVCDCRRQDRSGSIRYLRQDPPWFEFWSFLTFLHYGIEEVERHLVWKFYKKIRRKSWSNVPPKLLACIRFLYKVVHKIGRLRKFNRSREIEFNFFTAWTISIKFGTLVQHAPGYKKCLRIFNFCLGT